jgi:hypothetical protein
MQTSITISAVQGIRIRHRLRRSGRLPAAAKRAPWIMEELRRLSAHCAFWCKVMVIKTERRTWLDASQVIREGLNLLPCEYVYARKAMANAGVCLCSEFSTCASLLNGAIKINPFNARYTALSVQFKSRITPFIFIASRYLHILYAV